MNKRLIITMVFLLAVLSSTVCMAYSPGQRTFKLLGETLNSDKHAVHLVVEQKIDMADVLTAEAYANLANAQKVRYVRTEYNELNGINAEHVTITDGDGNIISDSNTFVKGGYWYTVDYAKKTYDRIPELPGMSLPFAETLVSWFAKKPESGNDPATGYDYDKVVKGDNELYFYFEKGTDKWTAYEVSYLPIFTVAECSDQVNADTAFALPPEDFKQVPNQTMRNFANKIMGR